MVHFQIEENLKEAEVRPELLPSSSTSLPIRSLNDVGDCVLLCGGRTLCLACAKKRMSQKREISLLWNYLKSSGSYGNLLGFHKII